MNPIGNGPHQVPAVTQGYLAGDCLVDAVLGGRRDRAEIAFFKSEQIAIGAVAQVDLVPEQKHALRRIGFADQPGRGTRAPGENQTAVPPPEPLVADGGRVELGGGVSVHVGRKTGDQGVVPAPVLTKIDPRETTRYSRVNLAVLVDFHAERVHGLVALRLTKNLPTHAVTQRQFVQANREQTPVGQLAEIHRGGRQPERLRSEHDEGRHTGFDEIRGRRLQRKRLGSHLDCEDTAKNPQRNLPDTTACGYSHQWVVRKTAPIGNGAESNHGLVDTS